MMLVHDPARPSDNTRYWNGAFVLFNDEPAQIRCRDNTVTIMNKDVPPLPLSSPELSVKPVVAQYIKGRLVANVAQRRALKGYAGTDLDILSAGSQILQVGEVCTRDSSGHVWLLGERHAVMTTAEYREFRKEFLCKP